jgi:DNA-binding phage protein
MKILKRRDNIGKHSKRKKATPTIDYKAHVLKDLKNLDYAAGYLTAALEEGDSVFLLAIRDVVQARATKLNRENLYDMLSTKGNPRLSSITSILYKLGLEIKLIPLPG